MSDTQARLDNNAKAAREKKGVRVSELLLQDGQRPPEALQYAMGRAHPPLSDEQCQVFLVLLEEQGGLPAGLPEAQAAFRERYTPTETRWED